MTFCVRSRVATLATKMFGETGVFLSENIQVTAAGYLTYSLWDMTPCYWAISLPTLGTRSVALARPGTNYPVI
jgi:hypothetical protein